MTDQNEELEQDEMVPEGCVCSEDEAHRVIATWAKGMGLSHKFDERDLFPEEVSALRKSKKSLIAAIVEGNLVLDDEGQFVFTPWPVGSDAKLGTLVFREPDVAMLKEARKERNSVQGQVNYIAKITQKDQIVLGKMKQRNMAVCDAIVGLFLG